MSAPFSLRIAGPLEDAFIYRTTLVAWTLDQRLVLVDVADLEELLRERFGDLGAGLSYLFFHSRGIGAQAGEIRFWHLLNRSAEAFGTPTVELNLDDVPHQTFRAALEADDLLDLLIFFDHIYLGTDTGLYSAPFTPDDPKTLTKMSRRIPDPCYATTASLGSVAASCAEAGLRVLVDEVEAMGRPRIRTFSDPSMRAEYVGSSLLNYTSRTQFDIYKGLTERISTPDAQHSRRVFASFSRSDQPALDEFMPSIGPAVGRSGSSSSEDDHGPDFVASWAQRLLVFRDGVVSSRLLRHRKGELRTQGESRDIAHYDGFPISAVPVGDRLVIETSTEIVSLPTDDHDDRGDQLTALPTGPVISLRSFPRSRRYLNIGLATGDSGLWIFANGEAARVRY
jgi:hypothetical protein